MSNKNLSGKDVFYNALKKYAIEKNLADKVSIDGMDIYKLFELVEYENPFDFNILYLIEINNYHSIYKIDDKLIKVSQEIKLKFSFVKKVQEMVYVESERPIC